VSSPAGTPWWVGVPPTEAVVACGPNEHTLRWDTGAVTAVDHLDADAEALMAALGAGEPTCVALVRHWAAHAADPRVLVAASRHPGDTLGLTGVGMAPVRAEGARRRAGSPRPTPDLDRHLGLLELLALDPALIRRLQQEVAHHLAGVGGGPALAAVEAATVGRLTTVLRRWTGGTGTVRVELGDEPGVRRDAATVTATVRPTWLAEVWGRYLAVVDGFAVVDVHRVVDDRAEVTGVGAPGGGPARLVLRGPAPWHVERRSPEP
jgi:hypothetical protein